MDRGFDRAHEPGAHVDALSAKSKRSSEALAVGKAAGRNEGDLQILACAAQEDEVGDVVLADVAGAFEAVDRQEVNAEFDGGLGMSDRGALVQDDGVGLLELVDHGARVVSGGLDDLDSLVDDHLGVGAVVGGHERGEES